MKSALLFLSLLSFQSVFCSETDSQEKFAAAIDAILIAKNQEVMKGILDNETLRIDEKIGENPEIDLPSCPPLMRATLLNAPESVKTLLEHNADVNATTEKPLNPELQKSLKAQGDDSTGWLTPLAAAIYQKKAYLIEMANEAGKDPAQDFTYDEDTNKKDIETLTKMNTIIELLQSDQNRTDASSAIVASKLKITATYYED